MQAIKILLIDDDRASRESLKTYLELVRNYEVSGYADSKSALDALAHSPHAHNALMMDWTIRPGGAVTLSQIKAINPGLPVIVFTANAEAGAEAYASGAYAYFQKPAEPERLAEAVEDAATKNKTASEKSFDLIHVVSALLMEQQSLGQFAEAIIRKANDLLDSSAGAFYLWSWKENGFQGLSGTISALPTQSESVLNAFLAKQTDILSDDIEDDIFRPFLDGNFKSQAAVLLRRADLPLGLLTLGRQAAGFNEEDRKTLRALQAVVEPLLEQIKAREFLQSIEREYSTEENVGQAIVHAVFEMFGQPTVLWLLDRGYSQLKIRSALGIRDSHKDIGIDVVDKNSLLARVIKDGKTYSWEKTAARNEPAHPSELIVIEEIDVHSILVIPLVTSENAPIGALTVYGKQTNAFKEYDIQLAQGFATQAAKGLENLHRHMQSKKLAELSEALVSSDHNEKNILATFAKAMSDLTGAYNIAIYPYDSKRKYWFDTNQVIIIEGGEVLEETKLTEKPRDKGLAFIVRHAEQPILVEEIRDDLVSIKPISNLDKIPDKTEITMPFLEKIVAEEKFIKRKGIRAFAGISLRALQTQADVGVMYVNFKAPHKFAESEVSALQIAARQAASIVQGHRLTMRQQLVSITLEEVINVIGITNPENQLSIILEKTTSLFSADYGTINRLAEDGRHLRHQFRFVDNHIEIEKTDILRPIRAGIIGHVIKTGESFRTGNVHKVKGVVYDQYFSDTQSEMAIPLKNAFGGVTGVLNLESKQTNFFNKEDQELCESFARAISAVIQQSELFEATKSLHLLTESSNLKDVLDQVLRHLNKLIGAGTASSVNLYDQASKKFNAFHDIGPDTKIEEKYLRLHPREDGTGQYVIEHNKALFYEDVNNIPKDMPRIRPEAKGWNIVSYAAFPLVYQEQKLGTLYVHKMGNKITFTDDAQQMLALYADQAAIAIENKLALEQRKKDLDALSEVIKAIGEENPIPLILEKAALMLDANYGYISTIEGEFLVHGAFWQNGEFLSGEQIPQNMRRQGRYEGISGHVVQTKELYYVPDLLENPLYYLKFFEDIRSELCVPLKDEAGDVIGVLNLESRRADDFPLPKRTLCESFAQIAADVLNKEKLRNRLDFLNRQLDTLHSITQGQRIEDVATQILESINNILGNEITSSSMVLYDQAKDEFPLCKAAGPLKEHLELAPRKEGGKARFMLKYRKPLFEQDVLVPQEDAPLLRDESLQFGIKSSAILPLICGTRMLGVLFVHQTQQTQFDEQMKKLLVRFADQAAVVIENNQIYEQQVDYLNTLQEINAAIGKENLDVIYQKIVQKTREIIGGTSSSLWILNKSKNMLEIGAMAGLEPKERSLPLNHNSINGHVAITRRPYISGNVADDRYNLRWHPEIQSSLTIPMMYGAQLIGTLDVRSTLLAAFSEDQMKLLQALGNLAAIALTNASSYEQRVSDFETLVKINAAVGEKSPQEIQQMIVENAVKLTGADYGVLWQLNETGQQLDLLAIQGREPIEQKLLLEPDTIHRKVILERKGRNIGDVLNNLDYRGWYVEIQSHLQVPMFVGEKLVGTLQVESTEKEAFTEGQQNILQALANQAAVALEKDRWLKDLGRLNLAGRSISSVTSSVQEVIKRASEKAMELLNTRATSVWLYESPKSKLVCKYATGLGAESVVNIELEPGTGLVGWCFRNNQSLTTPDAFKDQHHFSAIEESTKAGLHSIASIPLHYEDRVIGVLQVLHEATDYFQPAHIAMLEPLAAFTANAIESVQMIDRLQFINKLGKEMTFLRSEREIYDVVHKRAEKTMYTSNMFIALYDSKKNEVSFAMAYINKQEIDTLSDPKWKPRRDGNGLTEEVIETQKPLLMKTFQEQNDWFHKRGKNYINKTFASWLGVPILYGNQVLGVIAVFHEQEEYKYSDDDTQVLALMAGQMAVAIKNLREVNTIQTLSDNLLKETTSVWEQEPALSAKENA